MRRTDRVAVALITGAAALAGSLGLARTTSLGPYHHPPQAHDPGLGQRASALDRLDASLDRALHSPLPPLPGLAEPRSAEATSPPPPATVGPTIPVPALGAHRSPTHRTPPVPPDATVPPRAGGQTPGETTPAPSAPPTTTAQARPHREGVEHEGQ